MHPILQSLNDGLELTASTVMTAMPNDEPLSIAHGNWNTPGVTRGELAERAKSVSRIIREDARDSLGAYEDKIADFVRRIDFLKTHTVPQLWGNAAAAVPAYLATLDSLRLFPEEALPKESSVDSAGALKRIATRIRAMESRVKDMAPRSAAVEGMIEKIEAAYDAADQLPADLESLAEGKSKLEKVVMDSEESQRIINSARAESIVIRDQLKIYQQEASAVIARCESAYSAATSQGLAAAFSDRSKALDTSMWTWVGGLVGSLALGGIFGSRQLRSLAELVKIPDASPSIVWLNLLLSLLSVGAPVWFAWISTKQIGQRFRLSEDYAFKASISRAYEGYRREAARVDPDMEAELLRSALARLDELPLRLVEPVVHGSPWHELLSSESIKTALKTVPDFSSQVGEMARKALSEIAGATRASASTPTASAVRNEDGT